MIATESMEAVGMTLWQHSVSRGVGGGGWRDLGGTEMVNDETAN